MIKLEKTKNMNKILFIGYLRVGVRKNNELPLNLLRSVFFVKGRGLFLRAVKKL